MGDGPFATTCINKPLEKNVLIEAFIAPGVETKVSASAVKPKPMAITLRLA
jgi:hypothetical protein